MDNLMKLLYLQLRKKKLNSTKLLESLIAMHGIRQM